MVSASQQQDALNRCDRCGAAKVFTMETKAGELNFCRHCAIKYGHPVPIVPSVPKGDS